MASNLQHEGFVAREAFFDRVVRQHARLLYRVAFSVLRNPADAEDAVSDVLLKLVRTGSWQTITNERAFLARVTWRSALDRFEARPPRAEEITDELPLPDGRPTPERQALLADRHHVLHGMIDRLPAELREPLLLSAVEELNSREIGEAMHLPEGTVRTRLMRARALLREQVQQLEGNTRDREIAARGINR